MEQLAIIDNWENFSCGNINCEYNYTPSVNIAIIHCGLWLVPRLCLLPHNKYAYISMNVDSPLFFWAGSQVIRLLKREILGTRLYNILCQSTIGTLWYCNRPLDELALIRLVK